MSIMKARSALIEVLGGLPSAVLFITVVVALTLLYRFNENNKDLKRRFDVMEAATYPAVGDYVADVPLIEIGNDARNSTLLASVRAPAVLYFFAPDCKYCEIEKEKLPHFSALERAKGYEFAAISTANPNDTRKMFPHAVSFAVLAENGGRIARSCRVAGTPIYVTVGADRRVKAVHLGVLSREKFEVEMLSFSPI